MKPRDILAEIVDVLNGAGVEHMLTGSFAGAYHGLPRATQDIDLVIAPSEAELTALVSALQARDYYVSEEAALEALETRGQFNAIDRKSGWKIDLIIRRNRAFSRMEFDRRIQESPLGFPVSVATAEDTILAKMEWAKKGGSDQQLMDVVGIMVSQKEDLDRGYIEEWVGKLHLEEEWGTVQERVESSSE